MAGQNNSKWLREEGDTKWEARIGGKKNCPRYMGEILGNNDKVVTVRSNFRRDDDTLNKTTYDYYNKSRRIGP